MYQTGRGWPIQIYFASIQRVPHDLQYKSFHLNFQSIYPSFLPVYISQLPTWYVSGEASLSVLLVVGHILATGGCPSCSILRMVLFLAG